MANEQKQKALAIEIAKVAKKIVPELVELTKGEEFQLTIVDDGEGFGILVNVSDNPQVASILIHDLMKKEEDDLGIIEEADAAKIDEAMKERIIKALDKTNRDRRRAAELVGISERSLNRKIKQYGLKK